MQEFKIEPYHKIVPKPWGHETLYTTDGMPYAGKVMFVKGGTKWSLHYHESKKETLMLLSGIAQIWLEDNAGKIQKIPMELQQGYNIAINQKHRVVTIEDCVIVEASEPEVGKTVRVEDDYKRGDETEELRKLENRGWTKHS